MDRELFEKVTELFDAVRRLSRAERTAYLDENCGGDGELRAEVESLVAHHDAASGLLSESVGEHGRGSGVRSPGADTHRVGPFKLLEKLGEGGMGVVYLAEQTEPVRRRVAVKVIKVGMDTKEVVARFEAERQALALMDHANIARIFDAGATEEGRPYFVLELVHGVPITDYCDHQRLTLRERLNLFVQVCDAVQHAHLKGVIHRDIKPSNILVCCPQEVPVAKVIDFGVAKATNQRLTEKTLYTAIGRAVGTPAYMSPEQAEMTAEEVDTRTDIYSLGVLLYELIVGELPLELETNRVAYDEILRRIRTEEPPTPSTRWRRLKGEKTSKLAERRRTNSTALARELRGDLDWIAMKALEKERDRRYPTAAHLAEDIGRCLRDEVVLARAPSMLYRLRKFARRNRGPIASVAYSILALALFAGLLVWRPWQERRLVLTHLKRLTSNPGLTLDPCFSSDGKFVVYASDRGGEGSLDVWMENVERAEVRRLTFDEADDREPSISPDGTQIAFRSDRDGGGIYVMPAAGGERASLELLANGANRPRFSPDGKLVAYWVGQRTAARGGAIYVMEANGGPPRQVAPEMRAAREPVWSPDGNALLFLGSKGSDWVVSRDVDWWIVPVQGGAARRTEAFERIPRGKLRDMVWPAPDVWARSNQVVFSAQRGDSRNLWSVAISPRLEKVLAAPQLLVPGSEQGSDAQVVGDGRLVFAKLALTVDVWSLPLDANQGVVEGPMERLTHDLARGLSPSLSDDGETLVFLSTRSGAPELSVKDLGSGDERLLRAPGGGKASPVLSPDKRRVAYRSKGPHVFDLLTGRSEEVHAPRAAQAGSRTPSDWSADGKRILLSGGWLVDVSGGQETRLVEHKKLYGSKFSPDERWIAFNAIGASGLSRVYVAPVAAETLREDRWQSITEDSTWEDKPCWSPDGNLLYFTSDRDGFRCIYAQRLDPETKEPLKEELIDIKHFHSSRLSPMNLAHLGDFNISVARDKIVFNLGELTGSIWTARLEEKS